jgi:arabinan endo-1,5-alpha-L-arabinosidase
MRNWNGILSRGFTLTLAAIIAALSARAAEEAGARQPEVLDLGGDIERVHDPAVIRDGDTYYVFSTGGGFGRQGIIPIRTSKDLLRWELAGAVFERLPEWAAAEVPRARGAWAPDISRFDGKFHLYYAVSSFGSRNSGIGLATNRTLDPRSPDYRWVDEGLVVRSREDQDDWNAIDPNLVIESPQDLWLAWGSFWDGIKMRRVDPRTGKLSAADATLHALARRDRAEPIGGSVEAPFIVRRGDSWYLFVSFDRCCKGKDSTYKVMVGRGAEVTGPYLDRSGRPMMEGGGTLVIEATTPAWRGPGHQAVLLEPGGDHLLFHAYHGTTGRPYLQVSTLTWEDGWPRAGTLPEARRRRF